MSKKIVFKIGKDGDVKIESLEGYGSSCMDATSMLERALGKADESTRKMTHEYSDAITQDNEEHIQH
jgi:GTP cyclohydrolase III